VGGRPPRGRSLPTQALRASPGKLAALLCSASLAVPSGLGKVSRSARVQRLV